MGLFKAVRNYALRSGNDRLYNKEKESLHDIAFAETGKDIAKAKKKGYRINARKNYKRHFNDALTKAQQKKERRDKFISDL